MTRKILSATPNQRKNIIALVGYLLSVKDTSIAAKYDHEQEDTCTFGLGILSRKIKALNGRYTVNASGESYEKKNYDTFHSDHADAVYGADYWKHVVYGPFGSFKTDFDGVTQIAKGVDQFNFIVNGMIESYQITDDELAKVNSGVIVLTKEVDATKTKIEERIKKLKAFLNIAEEFKDDRTIKLTDQVKAVKEEIKALELALSL